MEGWDEVKRQGRLKVVNNTGLQIKPEEVLITSAPWDVYQDEGYTGDIPCFTRDRRVDWFAHHPLAYPEMYHPSVKSRSYEIAFLKENVPGPTYLEVPDQQTVIDHLATGKYKVLGISAFTWTLPWALKIAERAKREFGVQETWLGGYAIMTPEPKIEQVFDKLFAGYSEGILRTLFGMSNITPKDIKHPDLTVTSTYLGREVKVGHLYWERGCTQRCTFCADPVFQPGGESTFSLENVHEIIKHYKKIGCISVHLVNQDVRPFTHMGMEIIKILKQYQMPFTMMTSLLALMAKGHEGLKWLREMGLTMVQPGIESLDDVNLKSTLKNSNVEKIENMVQLLDDTGIRLSATYMICLENDTAASIRQAKYRLGQLGPIYTYFSVTQPMPGTPFYQSLNQRGLINDWDWRKWTGGYLVWKHPTISPEEARELLAEMDLAVNTPLHNRNLRREWNRIDQMKKRMEKRADMRGRVIFDTRQVNGTMGFTE